jgi:hypothetical protein
VVGAYWFMFRPIDASIAMLRLSARSSFLGRA